MPLRQGVHKLVEWFNINFDRRKKMAGFGAPKSRKKINHLSRHNGEDLLCTAIEYHNKGDLSNAERFYRLASDHGIKDFILYSNLALIFQATNRVEESIAYYKKAITISPNEPDPFNNLGSLYKQLGDFDQALILIRQSLALKPDNANALINLGSIYRNLGQLDQALSSTLKSLELAPENSIAYMNLGGIYQDLGKLDQALSFTLKSLELSPENSTAYMNLGSIYKDLGNLEQALFFTQKSLELNPGNFNAHLNLGSIYHCLGNLDQALASTSKCLELNPRNPNAFINLGGIYKDIGKLEESLAATRQSLVHKPDNPIAFLNLGGIYKDLGYLDQSLAFTLKYLEHKPDDSNALINLAGIYKDLGNLDKALASTLKLVELKPDSHDALITLAGIYKDLGDLDLALSSTHRSLELNPFSSKAFYSLGGIQMALGEFIVAKQSLSKAIEIQPLEYAPYYELSTILQSPEEALELVAALRLPISKTRHIAPRNSIFLDFALANCHHSLKNYDEAAKHLQLANASKLEIFPSDANSVLQSILSSISLDIGESTTVKDNVGKERIFIVGMPRSGSTLLETILSMSPQIKDLGETRSLKIAIKKLCEEDDFNSRYQGLDEIYAQLEPIDCHQHKYTTDKNLYNLAYINIIASCMPAAKIIHCRRNPMDNILSMFRSNLMVGNNYTSKLEDAANVLIAQDQAMTIQKTRNPGRIFTFDYDKVVHAPEECLRGLFEWLDIEFDYNYLHPEKSARRINTASLLQARRPISNKSVGGWRNYEELLKPALVVLKDSNIKFE